MAMSPDQVRERLQLLNTRDWPRQELEQWLGINFAEAHPLLAQFQMWNSGAYEVAFENPRTVDRNRFAMFLNARKYVPLRGAAVSLALTDESFLEIMNAERTRQLFQSEPEGAFKHVYNSEFISGFFKIFPRMRQSVFPSSDIFFDLLHKQIHENLQTKPQVRMCLTSQVLGERHYGESLDCITSEPMSLLYQVFLDTPKPLQLRPDAVSWLTYFKFEDILRPALLGAAPSCSEEQKTILKGYVPRN